jgi:hypothetical protein
MAMDAGGWDDLSPDDQMCLLQRFMAARGEALTEPTERTLMGLESYVSRRVRAVKRADTAGRTARRTALGVGAGALLTLGIFVGQVGGDVSSIAAPAGSPVTYSATVKGKCVDASKTVLLKKGARVIWQARSGAIVQRTLKRKTRACVSTAVTPARVSSTVNAAGVITAVQVPSNPTVADIAALGLSRTSKVAPDLRIPMPSKPTAAAKLADTVTPVRAYMVEQPRSTGWSLDGGETFAGTESVVYVEWELKGGGGVVDVGNGTYVPFASGVARVVTPIGAATFAGGVMTGVMDAKGIAADYGQSTLPPSVMTGWDVTYAKGASGKGNPVGIHANASNPDFGQVMDGAVRVDADMNILR